MRSDIPIAEDGQEEPTVILGARYAKGPEASAYASLWIAEGRIVGVSGDSCSVPEATLATAEVDLSGFLIMPGLINAHDHLEFALYPRLANAPYRNYIDWGEDIHTRYPDAIAKHRAVPKDVRVWWGGIRNLLCGVTTVSHHNPLELELQRKDFPVRVVQKYGWAHSLTLGGDLLAARAATSEGCPFIVHACEGVDELARKELWGLDRLGVLDAGTVLVHGLAIDAEGLALIRKRRASLIICPSSNNFLFGQLPDTTLLMNGLENVSLGNDSPLTAEGDLMDEIRFAVRSCAIAPAAAYRMVTEAPAAILRLEDSEGSIKVSGIGDLIAVRDTGHHAADKLHTLSMVDVEFVMVGGNVKLASEAVMERLPLPTQQALEPLWIDGTIRWLRAPVGKLLRSAEAVLGAGCVRLGGRLIRIPAQT